MNHASVHVLSRGTKSLVCVYLCCMYVCVCVCVCVTQTRIHLPVWLGIGDALDEAIAAGQLDTLTEMYKDWPFFQV